ncbi:oligopeptide ABC transporter ATP-binding protein OppD [Spiroplasma cantharicola]|uniref:Oligopeptide ABC transporter ATP-binding protein n=1 Tax=Spiroplasma cantharicola TaxID=362837 RepID=A0A0M3SJF8_9MOLU|nr:oligopeptide ABC transporter ATP-binding protein OppD [Spiroplasma cantharicola]ALD66678.1 oligopeptide ABC transporter ATP-binding protein [Spiroplasma cantharicola]
MNKENRIISVRDMEVKFQVRGNFLTAIRTVDLDVYDQEILAIVGESGSGKSVITKTFTGMLEANGWVSNGSIVYRPTQESIDDQGAYFKDPIDIVNLQSPLISKDVIKNVTKINNEKIKDLFKEIKHLYKLNPKYKENREKQELKKLRLENKIESEHNDLVLLRTKQELQDLTEELNSDLLNDNEISVIKENNKNKQSQLLEELNKQLNQLQENIGFSGNNRTANKIIKLELKIKAAEETIKIINDNSLRDELIKSKLEDILKLEIDINKVKPLNMKNRHQVSKITSMIEKFIENNVEWNEVEKQFILDYFYSKDHLKRFEKELRDICLSVIETKTLDKDHFHNILIDWKRIKNSDLVNKVKALKEIRQLRGKTISTIFQDPMTSLNPLLPVGFQITEVLRKQVGLSRSEAKAEAIELLRKVGIPNPEKRYKDIPGRYSGGMRQRVVIAIALASRPKILICDEPTTALDVTIQAQILDLIKELQEEYKFSVVFITHDLGVVAKIADRVAVMYAGQIVEVGTTKEIFEDSKHPYTWALLSSLPQLGKKGDDLFSIEGTPPSLFNEIIGDAFAPRNKFALELDYIKQPPMFKVSETHFAKTWLLDPRSPKVKKPNVLNNLRKTIKESEKVG